MFKSLCSILGHRRSRSRAHNTAMGWRSVCKRCNANLLRDRSGKWDQALDSRPDEQFPSQIFFKPTGAIIAVRSDRRVEATVAQDALPIL